MMTYEWLTIKGCHLYLGRLSDGRPLLLGYVAQHDHISHLFAAYLVGGRDMPAQPLLSERLYPAGATLTFAQAAVEEAVAVVVEMEQRAGGAV